LIPGVTFCNTSTREPIDETDAERLEGPCSICSEKSTYLVRCAYDSCNVAYHTRCAAENVYCDMGNAVIYCREHDPLHKRRRIMSRRSLLRERELYPDIVQEIELRERVRFSESRMGKYLRLVEDVQKVTAARLKRLGKAVKSYGPGALNAIGEYWRIKRAEIGYYFEDMFMFPNRFLFHKAKSGEDE